MDDARAIRLIDRALRCYPARWRRRHGQEAAELAALLIEDGTPAASIALSYLAGAARERLTPRPGPRLTAIACALLVLAGSLGASAGLLVSAAPARAAPARAAPARAASTRAASAGQPRGRPQCRPTPAAQVPSVTTALDRTQLIIWEAGHGRTC
jgi:hypothetical protein